MTAASHLFEHDISEVSKVARVAQQVAPASRGSHCGVCGSHEVVIDYLDGEALVDTEVLVDTGAEVLELGECQHCAHRWTRSLATCESSEANAHVLALLDLNRAPLLEEHQEHQELPHAA